METKLLQNFSCTSNMPWKGVQPEGGFLGQKTYFWAYFLGSRNEELGELAQGAAVWRDWHRDWHH